MHIIVLLGLSPVKYESIFLSNDTSQDIYSLMLLIIFTQYNLRDQLDDTSLAWAVPKTLKRSITRCCTDEDLFMADGYSCTSNHLAQVVPEGGQDIDNLVSQKDFRVL